MSRKNIVILIIVVALVALIGWSASRTQPGGPAAAPPTGRPATSTTVVTAPPLNDAEKQSLVKVPPPEAPRAEQDAHFARVVEVAEDGTSIDVTKCANEPFVLRIKRGETLTLRNDGASEAVVDLGGSLRKVPPNGTAALEAGFGIGAGLFGYGCNTADGNGSAFILVVTE